MGTAKPKRTWVEIDPNALRANLCHASELADGAEVMAVVKADAYGHGFAETIKALDSEVSAFGVATLNEALAVMSVAEKTPNIMILGALLPDEREEAVSAGLHVTISSLLEAKKYNEIGQRTGSQIQAHLVLDTGMGRLGFTDKNFIPECAEISSSSNIAIEGIATHFPCSDLDLDFTKNQIEKFSKIIQKSKLNARWIHLSNSAGVINFGNAGGNMIRPGLMLYGICPTNHSIHKLRPAMEWKTRITQVRELPSGSGISYGQTFITKKNTSVATVAVGYGDGYPRSVSGNDAEVIIKEKRCSILGRVTMDMIMVDVSDLDPLPCPGDEVTLLGGQMTEPITATELASKAGTIPWEILTGISPRVERIIST
ncbi:MAG: alanine racemase [Verrucomicrobiales bacterium]|nr:alanine racemase [Verrucomicrobiales bacterium]